MNKQKQSKPVHMKLTPIQESAIVSAMLGDTFELQACIRSCDRALDKAYRAAELSVTAWATGQIRHYQEVRGYLVTKLEEAQQRIQARNS